AVSAAVALPIVAAAVWLKVPQEREGAAAEGRLPTLAFVRTESGPSAEVLAERMAAYDPTPMFLPVAVDGGEQPLPAGPRDDDEGPFGSIPPALTKSGLVPIDVVTAVPRSPVA